MRWWGGPASTCIAKQQTCQQLSRGLGLLLLMLLLVLGRRKVGRLLWVGMLLVLRALLQLCGGGCDKVRLGEQGL